MVALIIFPAEGRLSECSQACGFPHVGESAITPSEKAGDLEVLDCFQQLKLLQLMFVIEKKCAAPRF